MGRNSLEVRLIDRVLRWGTATGEADDLLLERFLAERDEGAFAALVDRHGPLVLGVCRRILRDGRDVEDAFQATFLILARRAGTIRSRERIGPWLHGVAHRVAVRARAISARRLVREGIGLDVDPATDVPPGCDAERLELRSILDEELGRLPGRLRDPLVLCHLQGLTHDQAAAALRQPVGTIRSRLSRGRERLRDRLARRGVSVDDARMGLVVIAHQLPTALFESTLRSAVAFASTPTIPLASASAAVLANGALNAMLISKAKLAAVALGMMLTLGGVSGHALQQGVEERPDPVAPEVVAAPATLDGPETTVERLEGMQKELDEALAQREALATRIDNLRTSVVRLRSRLQTSGGVVVYDEPIKSQVPQPEASTLPLADSLRNYLEQLEKKLHVAGIKRQSAEAEYDMMIKDREVVREKLRDLMRPSEKNPAAPTPAPGEAGAPTRHGETSDSDPAHPAATVAPFLDRRPLSSSAAGSGKRSYLASPKMILVSSKDGHVVTGYSSETGGEARSIRLAPEGGAKIKVTPYLGVSVAALALEGEAVDRIAVFSATDGEWHPYDLVEPTRSAMPQIGAAAVGYKIGRRIYAFSFVANKWDVLELPEDGPDLLWANPETITYQSRGRLHVFSGKTGKWASIDVSNATEYSASGFP
ncbi:RNA polymerase sigma factor [Planctomyces sp. SH-PL62]|uniref:RNA polymerase sigma factor n=1 Tax=Planctomyces sp. SH-PL62 TaxID=1636152 RepID=UPI00078CD3C1|nr:RNA polymerase sigma factor [Planctomyces sp. SH-PL62]AMV36539.1 ECF RNA polymerase sigma factor SigE [Planctomyces sp. SH-PL62]